MKQITLAKPEAKTSLFAFSQIPNEKARRQFLALEADAIGYGGISAIARVHGVSRAMIRRGMNEIESEGLFEGGRQRKEGAGRPSYTRKFSENMALLLIEKPQRFESCSDSEWSNYSFRSNTQPEENTSASAGSQPGSQPDAETEATETVKKARKRRGLDIEKMIENYSSRLAVPSTTIVLPPNPLDPESWIEQIVQEQFAAVYGNPAWPQMYVNLTLNEIRQRYEYRTQQEISIATLWNLMHNMGLSLHKNMKFETLYSPR